MYQKMYTTMFNAVTDALNMIQAKELRCRPGDPDCRPTEGGGHLHYLG